MLTLMLLRATSAARTRSACHDIAVTLMLDAAALMAERIQWR